MLKKSYSVVTNELGRLTVGELTMKQKILLLTKSRNVTGYCVAGVNIENGEWIRLTVKDKVPFTMDELRYSDGNAPALLDTIIVDLQENCGTIMRPEDYFIEHNAIERAEVTDIGAFYERLKKDYKHKYIYYNEFYKIYEDEFPEIGDEGYYSLQLIKPDEIHVLREGQDKFFANIKYKGRGYLHIRIMDEDFIDNNKDLEIGSRKKLGEDVYTVISLSEKYYNPNNGRYEYYKLVSSIISALDEANFNETINAESQISLESVEILAEQIPGVAKFNNFLELKAYLQAGLSAYTNTQYSVENMEQAKTDLSVLKELKKKLTSKKKQLKEAYTEPIDVVMTQIDELIDMVKIPYDIIDKMLKSNAKEIKEQEIISYARSKAIDLGKNAERLVSSPAFFNPRWKNISYKERYWKRDVDQIIERVQSDIRRIVSLDSEKTNILLTIYFENLSFNSVLNFVDSLKGEKKAEHEGEFIFDMDTGEIFEKPKEDDEKAETIAENINYITREVKVIGEEKNVEIYLGQAETYGVKIDKL